MAKIGDIVLSAGTGLSICAAAAVGIALMKQDGAPSQGPALTSSSVAEWTKYASRGFRLGSPSSPVQIVVFADYQCPACRYFDGVLDSLVALHPSGVTVTYRHHPIPAVHPAALGAAIAAECAAQQDAFQSYSRALFQDQVDIGIRSFESYAEQANVADLDAFSRCVDSDVPRDAVEADIEAAAELGLNSTPSFLVNDRLWRSAIPLRDLDRLVRAAGGEPVR